VNGHLIGVKDEKSERRGSAPVDEILRSAESNNFSDSEEGEEVSGLDASGFNDKEKSVPGSDRKGFTGDTKDDSESDQEKNSFNQNLSEMNEENEFNVAHT
jgi:hypothetical protein